MTVTLLHTAEAHRAGFDTLRDRIAPDTPLTHVVRPDWLARAQDRVTAELEAEIAQAVTGASGRVICTCSTLGGIAAKAGAIRIDQPMMQAAATTGGPILLAYCLDSTLDPSLGLLDTELAAAGTPAKVHPLPLRALWPLFQAGQSDAFAIGIAGEIRQVAARLGDLGCVVLAQASMAGAAALLTDLGVPVLSSPEPALCAALKAR